MAYEKEIAAGAEKLLGLVVEYIESHHRTVWYHELPEGGGEDWPIEAYLIPKKEVDAFRAAMKSLKELSV